MYFDTLPNEIVTHIFLSLSTVSSVLALSSTCQHFHEIFAKQKLAILASAADLEFGPIDDIIQIITQNSSQPAHLHRDASLSEALVLQVLEIGKVTQQWEEIYPFKKWKADFANRRLLTSRERFLLRRAMHRLWLFTKAFHNRLHIRTTRNIPQVMHERATLLHNFSTSELAQMLDVHLVLRDVVANNICPSNGKIRQKFQKRYPESNHQLLFNIHLNYSPPSASPFNPDGWLQSSLITSSKYHSLSSTPSQRLQTSHFHEPGAEGWGDDISHYYVVEDMMKMDPRQILILRDHYPLKSQVEGYVRSFGGGGEWFVNNGETFSETLAFVLKQRGADMQGLKASIEDGEMGVAIAE